MAFPKRLLPVIFFVASATVDINNGRYGIWTPYVWPVCLMNLRPNVSTERSAIWNEGPSNDKEKLTY